MERDPAPLEASGSKRHASVLTVCCFICGVEFCERLSFYTFNGTQAFFLEHLDFPLSVATNINASMSTVCFLLTLLVGWFADVLWGRYGTILVSALLYIGASSVIAVASHPRVDSSVLYLVGTMGLVPIGTAGIKVCLSLFGADQFDASTPEGRATQERFFSWYFAAVNAGAFIAFALLVNLGNSGGLGVSRIYGYFASYVIAGVVMVAAVGLFLCGRSTYVVAPPPGSSSMSRVLRHLCVSAMHGSREGALVMAGLTSILVALVLSVAQNGSRGQAVTYVSAALAIFGVVVVLLFCPRPDWLDARGSLAPDRAIKGLVRLIPVILTGQIGGLMAQTVMQVWYQQQACQMDVRVGDLQLSGAFFNIADCFTIVLGTPIIMRVVNPTVEWLLQIRMGYAAKFYIGVFFGNFALLFAAALELCRRRAEPVGVSADCAPAGASMKQISAAWICVPYALTGVSEVYVMPTIMYITYDKSPDSMRTFAQIICMFMLSVTSCILSLVNKIMAKHLTDDLDKGHLEYVYYIIICISLVFTALFRWSNRVFSEREGGEGQAKDIEA